MPIATTECYVVSNNYYCENCLPSLPGPPSAAITAPAMAVRCCGCGLMMGPFVPRTMEELLEATPAHGGLCDACGIPRPQVTACLACGNARCAAHRVRCYDCSAELCAGCSTTCRCLRGISRCRSCAVAHTARCSNFRRTEARSGNDRPLPFDFLCDSDDATLVPLKFKRPSKTTPIKKARPLPGVFMPPRRPDPPEDDPPEEDLDDGDE